MLLVWEFLKLRGYLIGVLLIRILLFWVLYWGPLFSETPVWLEYLSVCSLTNLLTPLSKPNSLHSTRSASFRSPFEFLIDSCTFIYTEGLIQIVAGPLLKEPHSFYPGCVYLGDVKEP